MFTDDGVHYELHLSFWLSKHPNLAHTLAFSDHVAIMWKEIQPSKAASALSTQASPIQICGETVLPATDF